MTPANDERPLISPEEFLAWRSPRLGSSNPTVLTNPWWAWLVHNRLNAYGANKTFDGPSPFSAGPGWCFDRFGQTETHLPGGQMVYIGGEHEDYYDPDFFIYNDVVVKQPDGSVEILGYPSEVFPPTDFHTATLLPGRILLIGCLGYPSQRRLGETPVFQLTLDGWRMEAIATSGDGPAWIHKHTAVLAEEGTKLVISGGQVGRGDEKSFWENIDDWELDLASWQWTRLTRKSWQRLTLFRKDRKRHHLWDIRHAQWMRDVRWADDLAKTMQRLVTETGHSPDLDLVSRLYTLDASVSALPEGEEHNVFRVSMDGVVVRFTEDGFSVQVMVEGQLAPGRLDALQASLLEKLAALEGCEWEVEAP